MTNKELVNRNIGLTFDFVQHLIDNPNLIEQLPDKFELEFIEKDFSRKILLSSQKQNGSKRIRIRVGNNFQLT